MAQVRLAARAAGDNDEGASIAQDRHGEAADASCGAVHQTRWSGCISIMSHNRSAESPATGVTAACSSVISSGTRTHCAAGTATCSASARGRSTNGLSQPATRWPGAKRLDLAADVHDLAGKLRGHAARWTALRQPLELPLDQLPVERVDADEPRADQHIVRARLRRRDVLDAQDAVDGAERRIAPGAHRRRAALRRRPGFRSARGRGSAHGCRAYLRRY